jgi:hypothetical protein
MWLLQFFSLLLSFYIIFFYRFLLRKKRTFSSNVETTLIDNLYEMDGEMNEVEF